MRVRTFRSSTGLGSYERDYERVLMLQSEVKDALEAAEHALADLRDGVASGSHSRAYQAKNRAQHALGQISRTLESARLGARTYGQRFTGLPTHPPFDEAHRALAKLEEVNGALDRLRIKISRIAFGSLDDMKKRFDRYDRDPPTRTKQKKISAKIRTLRREGYAPKQAAAIAYRAAGVPPRRRSR